MLEDMTNKEKLIQIVNHIENILNIIIDDCDNELVNQDEKKVKNEIEFIPPHQNEIKHILERAASDSDFFESLSFNGFLVLDEYNLTAHEREAIISGDIGWIESHIGPLNECQRFWFEQRLTAGIWQMKKV